MNLRWLCFDYIDPAFDLNAEQRRTVQRRISQYIREFRLGMNPLDLAYLFVPLIIMAIPIALMQLNIMMPRTFGSLWAFMLPFAAIAWAAGTWIRWKSRQRLINRALRSLDYDVRVHCGYWLRGLGDDVKQCPECGAAREAMPIGKDQSL